MMRDELRVEGMEAGDASLRSLRDLDVLKQGADARRWLVVTCCLLPALAGCYADHDASRADAPMDYVRAASEGRPSSAIHAGAGAGDIMYKLYLFQLGRRKGGYVP